MLPEKHLYYWKLYVYTLHILLKTDLTHAEIDKADSMLHEFVEGIQEIFGKEAISYNLHIFTHLAETCSSWGALWTHSTFPPECGNKHLLNATHCSKGVVHQIVRHSQIISATSIIEELSIHTFLPVYSSTANTYIQRK